MCLSFPKLQIVLPFVAFKIFKLDAQHAVFIIGKHVDVLITKPELFCRVTKAILIIGPITVEVLSRIAEVIPPLDNLEH
jgi:hypothetical protein